MKKNLFGLMKSHLSSIHKLLGEYKYFGQYPNTQAGNVALARRGLEDFERGLRMIEGEDRQ